MPRKKASLSKKLVVAVLVVVLLSVVFFVAVVNGNFLGSYYGSVTDMNGFVHTVRSSDDASNVLNNALALGGGVFVKGTLTCFSPVTLSVGGSVLSSDGSGKLIFSGCNGLVIKNSQIIVHDLTIEQRYDLRSKIGVIVNGYANSAYGYETLYNLNLWGWSSALQLNYASSSAFSGIDTSFSFNGLAIYGQSVNNGFTGCHFSNFGTGTATVLIEKDEVSGAQPEGNNFVNCHVYGGTFGFELIYAYNSQIGSGCNVDGWQTNGVYALHSDDSQIGSGAWVGSTSAVQPAIMLDASKNSGVIGADIYVPKGSGVVLQGTSTGNTVSSHIVASVGIQEMSSSDDYNTFTGNNISGPVVGNDIIKMGSNTVVGNNVFH